MQPSSAPTSSRSAEWPGASVGHYLIGPRIGGGAQGVVYKATDSRLNRPVAIKCLFPHLCDDDCARERFLREARAASAVEHPNICVIHDIESRREGHMFIVMAYYDGQTLAQKLREGALSVEDSVEIAAQIAEGLAAAHARGVVHRDIKPGNLMVTRDGVRILDFGLARLADSAQLTLAGSVFGTPAYMSPEQTRGEAVDARSDVWSAGAVLYEMLTGRAPFRGENRDAICYAIRSEAAPSLFTSVDVPTDLERIVQRALRKDRRERFQSAHEMAVAVRRLQGPRTECNWTSPAPAWLRRRLMESESWRTIWSAVSPACTPFFAAARTTWRSRHSRVIERAARAGAAVMRPPFAW
jgi:serine/threonine protein kinase